MAKYLKSSYSHKEFIFKNGSIAKYMGYEKFLLELLETANPTNTENIKTTIDLSLAGMQDVLFPYLYEFGCSDKHYLPDIILKISKLIRRV